MRKHSTKFSCRITPLTPSMLEVVTALAAEDEPSTSPHSRAASSARDAQDAAVTPDLERKSDETEEVNIKEKEASNVKSGETEEPDLETTQSTARQSTITPRTLNFEEEAG
ncbi:hypothetical protein Tco_0361857, partial [Tanacetum coccineum]